MYLYAVAGSKTAKIMALFTLLAVIVTLLPVSAFAQELPTDTEAVDPVETGDDTTVVTDDSVVPPTDEDTAEDEEEVASEEEPASAAKMAAAVVTIDNGEDKPKQCLEYNLLANGSFEEPEVDGQWTIFGSVLGWLSSANELEIWKNFNGNGADTAADGEQNAELDGTTPTTLSQVVNVVPGNTYQISFAFSPRAGRDINDNAVKVKFNGATQGIVSADGTANSGNVWTKHTFSAIANYATTTLELEDISSATSFGTLIDNVEVCLVKKMEVEKEEETIIVTENTTNAENTNGWMFNRDMTTATPYEFNTNEAAIGDGALNVLPIGANAADKFIGEYFVLDEIDNVISFSYDFKIGASGDDTDEEQFYMNVYANYGTSSPTKFYDCRYNVVPIIGSVAGFTTVTFDPTQAYPVTTRGGATPSPYTCPAVPADMNAQSPNSTFRAFAINLGDTSGSDTGLDGYFDKVVLDTPSKITTFDFEPKKIKNDVITGCKFNDTNANGAKDEGEVNLPGWEIVLTQGDAEPQYDTTDENGCYSFIVEDGSYQISETQQKGWEQTATIGSGADGDICYIAVGDYANAEARQIPQAYTCDFGNHQIEINECTYSENLLVNGSFETPLVDPASDGWDIFDSIVDGLAWVVTWINPATEAPAVAKLELQDGRPASDGNQYAELDSNYTQPGAPQILGDARVKIAQTVPTVIGEEYTFKFDLSAIPGRRGGPGNNKVNVLVDGTIVDTHTADGRTATTTNWSTYSYSFTATTTSTEVALADAGRSNTFGTFVDNVSLAGCVPEDDGEDGGGDDDDDTPTRRGGGGGGTRINRTPTGEVLGASASTPTGMVLGEATSTMPVGAPNTGAGGTSTVSISLPTIVAILPKTTKIK